MAPVKDVAQRPIHLYHLLSWFSPLLFLALWELMVQVGLLDYRFFPPPSTVLRVLAQTALSGELWKHVGISLLRVFGGFVLGALPAVLLGLLMGWFRTIHALFDPLVAAIYPIPKIALLPLFMILLGIGETAKIFTIAVGVFFVVLITTADGVRLIDPVLIEAAQSYGAKGWKLFQKVILPATLPAIFTGLRLGLGTALLVIISAEFVASNEGIGYLIWMSWSTLAVSKMYVGLLVIALLGLLFSKGLERVRRKLMPWAKEFYTLR